ncbi:19621_t:CDS:2, partial [Racocetra fulgida]
QIIINRRADHQTTKTIKGKLLYSLNGADEKDLHEALLNRKAVFFLGLVEPSDHPDYYYIKKYHESEVIDLDHNDESMEVEKSSTTYLQPMIELLTSDFMSPDNKNKIYLGFTDETYQEIICLYNDK